MSKTSRQIESSCPDCGKKLDAATNIENDAVPVPGDIGICLYCQGVHIFTDSMSRRSPTEEDIASMPFVALSNLQRTINNAKEKDLGSE